MKRTDTRLIAFLALCALLSALCPADEVIILKGGDQYGCRIQSILDGQVLCTVGGETKTFSLDDVQRIDLQRKREFDQIDTAEGLAEASPLFADALRVPTADLKAKYPQAGYVVLADDTVVTLPGGDYTVDRTLVWRILEQRGSDSAMRSLYFFPELQRADLLFGITVGPDGSVAHLSDSAIKTEAVYPSQPEYNHRQRVRFTLKNAIPGATLFLKTRLRGRASIRTPLVLDRTFWADEPKIRQTVQLRGDAEALRHVDFTTSGGLKAAQNSHTWAVADAPQVFWESLMPPVSDFAPRLLIAYPKASWTDVAAAFTEGVDSAPPASKVAGTPRELYDFVRRDVRLIHVPQDALPDAPAAPDEVLSRGYGTTVEKTLLLEALLRAAGFDASTLLVRRRTRGALLPDVARLKGFNDAVVRLRTDDGGDFWLQCDSTKRGFGELAGDVQGSQGLDLTDGGIVEVPARLAETEGATRRVQVSLDEDAAALVTEHYILKGRRARAFRFICDMSAEEARKWAASLVGSELPGVDLVDFTHSDFEKCNAVETLSVTYRVPALAQKAGAFLIMRLPNAQYSPVEVGRTSRRWGIFWQGRESSRTEFEVTAPPGYTVYAVPDGAKSEADAWRLEAGFTPYDSPRGKVVFRELWERTALEAPKDAYKAYRQTLISRGLVRNEMIVFEKQPHFVWPH